MNDALGSRSNKPAAEGVFSLCLRLCRCFSAFTRGTDNSRNRQLKAPFRRISSDFEPALEPDAAAWYNTGSRKDGGTIDTKNQAVWESLISEEKRRALYDRQVATLKTFLEHGAITQAQHDKSCTI